MKKSKYHLNIGGASLLLLVVVFAMSIFAVLSIRASYHEKKMAEKNRDAIEAYYEADARAEEVYASLANAWKTLEREKKSDSNAVLAHVGALAADIKIENEKEYLTFHVEIDHNKEIQVTMRFSQEDCLVEQWRLVSEAAGNYDGEDIEIWDGIINME